MEEFFSGGICLFVCLYRPWILHPVWIILSVLGFIGFSLKLKVLGVCNALSTNGSYGYIGIGGGIPTFSYAGGQA